MSVIKAKRSENPLQVLGLALELALHTLTLCKNEKAFPKRDRWMLTGEIVRTALQVYIKIRHANRVMVDDMEDYARRMRLQNEAIEAINVLMGLIDIAAAHYSLPGRKVEHWIGLCDTLEAKARAWHRSNRAAMKPGAVMADITDMAVDLNDVQVILKEACHALAQRCADGLAADHGPGAV